MSTIKQMTLVPPVEEVKANIWWDLQHYNPKKKDWLHLEFFQERPSQERILELFPNAQGTYRLVESHSKVIAAYHIEDKE